MVGTTLAFGCGGFVIQYLDLLVRKHAGAISFFISFFGNQSSTECTHNACNIGANYFTAGNLFKAAKNSIIVEGTTLYNNVFA